MNGQPRTTQDIRPQVGDRVVVSCFGEPRHGEHGTVTSTQYPAVLTGRPMVEVLFDGDTEGQDEGVYVEDIDRLRPISRTPVQRLEALALANEIRSARAELKRQIREGAASAEQVLADPPPHTATMKVTTLLGAIPDYGPARVGKLLRKAAMSDAKTVGGMTDRQRGVLVELLRERSRA